VEITSVISTFFWDFDGEQKGDGVDAGRRHDGH
jgi:hypothetical protein